MTKFPYMLLSKDALEEFVGSFGGLGTITQLLGQCTMGPGIYHALFLIC